jgi:hypothetical protein
MLEIIEINESGVTNTPLDKISKDIEQELWSALKTGNFQVTSSGSRLTRLVRSCCLCDSEVVYFLDLRKEKDYAKDVKMLCKPCAIKRGK